MVMKSHDTRTASATEGADPGFGANCDPDVLAVDGSDIAMGPSISCNINGGSIMPLACRVLLFGLRTDALAGRDTPTKTTKPYYEYFSIQATKGTE